MHSNMPGRNKGPSKPKGDCFVCGLADILVILPSNVAKEVQLIVQSAEKGDNAQHMKLYQKIYQKHVEVNPTRPRQKSVTICIIFSMYEQWY